MSGRSGFSTLAVLLLLALPMGAGAATITIVNADGASEGFNDPTPATPVGGNPGTTIGQQRLYVFQYAAGIWGSILPSAVEIRVTAKFDPIAGCTANAGTLGSTTTPAFFANQPTFPVQQTFYPQALANKLAGTDLNTTVDDMSIIFNSDVDNAVCLGAIDWYYGVDGLEGTDVELLPVVLHEIGHGLGFNSQVNIDGTYAGGTMPSIYARFILDNTTGQHWDQMTASQRAVSFINTGNVVWDGPAMNAQAPLFLDRQRIVSITSPAVIAGNYRSGYANFANDLKVVTAPVVLADDGVADLSTSNGCTPLVNTAQIAGNIVLIDRGTCTLLSKAQAAQAAGAIGAIIADTLTSVNPLDMNGSDNLTIPVAGITRADALLIKGQLAAGVTATLGGRHPVWLTGADDVGHARLYAPNPPSAGSSISHLDLPAVPNLLMEPSVSASLSSQVDLARQVLRDIGWFTGSNITSVPQGSGPDLQLASAPNPFEGATTVSFRLAKPGPVELDVYGVDGRHIRRLAGGPIPAGTHAFTWDGRGDDGRSASPGVYLVRLHAQEGTWAGRVVRLH